MWVAGNADKPGALGLIGSFLGDHDVNIAGMFNSRGDEPGGEALTVYNLDDPVPDSVVATILDDDRMIDVRYLTLNGHDDE